MAEVKYGKVEWEEGDVSTPSDFMNLVEGDNDVRVFTKPFQFHVAWVKDSTGAPRKVKSSVHNCPLMKRGEKVQTRWYVGVLDRKSDIPKILEISTQVYVGIKNLVTNSKWGPIEKYDINIKRGPKGSQPLYTVFPYPSTDLTAEEKVMIERFNEKVDLGKFTQPPTPEEVAEKLTQLGLSVPGGASSGQASVKTSATDEDFTFDDDLTDL